LVIDECHEVAFDQEDSQYMKIIAELLRRQPKLRIIGLTGSPYRGVKDILAEFWKQCVYRVRTPYLVDRGFLVPTIFGFGHDDVQYDLSEFKIADEDDHADYTAEELLAMQRKITADQTVTQRIMAEVIELTKHRNCVMITGAGKKHLEQIAECLPPDSWVIITDSTGNKERRLGLKQAYDGKKKYLLQIGCLTTGIDIPLIDTSVIMRKIGSLTLLVQLEIMMVQLLSIVRVLMLRLIISQLNTL
jgi:superfamily II DNA or RNA helicase